jgi:hypothetical protein
VFYLSIWSPPTKQLVLNNNNLLLWVSWSVQIYPDACRCMMVHKRMSRMNDESIWGSIYSFFFLLFRRTVKDNRFNLDIIWNMYAIMKVIALIGIWWYVLFSLSFLHLVVVIWRFTYPGTGEEKIKWWGNDLLSSFFYIISKKKPSMFF